MKISNNFKTIPRHNPDRLAKLEGSGSKPEIAGGMPRKKPRNHTLCGDRERAECTKERAMMPVTQDGGDDDPAEEGGPPKAPTKSGVTLEALVEDVLKGDEDNNEFVLGGADRLGEMCLRRRGGANRQAGHGHGGPVVTAALHPPRADSPSRRSSRTL